MAQFRVQREDDFDFQSSEYVDLYKRANSTPFQHPLWLSRIYDVLAPQCKASKQVITARREDGLLVLVLPLLRRRLGLLRVLEYADLGVSDYAAPVLDPDATAALIEDPEVAGEVRSVLGRFDLMRIERVAESPSLMISF